DAGEQLKVLLVYHIDKLPPVADAGPDRTTRCTSKEGADVVLDGSMSRYLSASQPIYAWSKVGSDGQRANISGPFAAKIHVISPPGDTTYWLHVADGVGGEASDTPVHIHVDCAP